MDTITSYIELGIANGYRKRGLRFYNYEKRLETGVVYIDPFDREEEYFSLEKMITSKKFLEAICRGIGEEEKEDLHRITMQQATALREGTLKPYIKSILIKQI